MREHCICLDDDEYGRNPDGECFCYDNGARCSCPRCQEAGRAGAAGRLVEDDDYREPLMGPLTGYQHFLFSQYRS